ncbi:MAG TPA: tRNA lysidine(34) synthetase TilS [Candidatus Blautia stercoravium]|nr:tRNA lysidine(34) synthetase TilS [Candidatus Blautia stercoravium]
MNMEEKVFSYIEKYDMIETGSQVIVGVSGGADSVCLLFLLKEYQKQRDFSLSALHVNHGIRGEEALRDQNFSGKICEELQVSFQVYEADVPRMAAEKKLSLEEAGREARRTAFGKMAEEYGKKKVQIALAHHENDNAETVLHNLIRGTGAAGLGGIRPVWDTDTQQGLLRYIRPLLGVSRKEIEEFLRSRKIPWITDSTNLETQYTRNKIRHEVLPVLEHINPAAVQHMGHTAGTMLQIEEYLQEQADMLYREYAEPVQDGYCIRKGLFHEKELMQSYVVMQVLSRAGGERKNLTSTHIQEVLALAKGRTGALLSLPGGLLARQVYGDVHIIHGNEREKTLCEMEFQILPWEKGQIEEKTYTKWFDYDRIVSSLEIRHRKTGDFLTVNAQGGRKKLKDYFIDCKIPREEREELTLLADGSHILWIVGYRISEYYKVTSQTKRVLKVQVKGVNEDE